MLDGNYLLDAGAERLTLEWKRAVGKLIDERDGVKTKGGSKDDPKDDPEDDSKDDLNPAFRNLLYNAGSSKYVPEDVPNMDTFERHLLTTTLAPIESDGPEDDDEWNLFDEYLVAREDDPTSLDSRHTLSATLFLWGLHVVS